jgi:acetylornithine deacetylase/succinyl-diaminopimelate desuccinylase-like protein
MLRALLRPSGLAILATGLATPAQPSPVPPESLRTRVADHVRARQVELLQEYVAFLALPNLASDASGIRRNAEHIVQMLERRGVASRLLDGEGGPPVVYGELDVGARKTVALYAHYDGQPVEADRWASPPWTPVLRDGPLRAGARQIPLAPLGAPLEGEWRIFARSASDDKAPILAIAAALDALVALRVRPSVNLKLFFEGEEEMGSPHLAQVLKRQHELLRADAWLLCDGPVHQSRSMQILFGVRGVTDVEITVYGPSRAVHSGHYGNWAPNPALTLAHLVAGLRDRDGRITIPGFYDDVRRLPAAERRALARLPFSEKKFQRDLGAPALFGEKGFTTLERLWARPTLEINGVCSGFIGEGAKTVLPCRAMAKVSMRLVPNQDPNKIARLFVQHVKRLAPKTAKLKITEVSGRGKPWLVPTDHPSLQAVANAIEKGFGKKPVYTRTGGTIPVVATLDRFLKAPILLMGIGLPDENAHAPNEKLDLDNLHHGMLAAAYLFEELGETGMAKA